MIRKIKTMLLSAVLPVLLFSCGKLTDPVFDPSLPSPLLYLPANHATGQDTTISLSWATVYEASDYDIEVAKDSAFLNLVAQDFHVSGAGSPVAVSITGLLPSSAYYWHVRSRRTGIAVSAWSAFRQFRTLTIP